MILAVRTSFLALECLLLRQSKEIIPQKYYILIMKQQGWEVEQEIDGGLSEERWKTYLLTYLPTYLLTYLPTYLLTYLPTYLLTYLVT
jgi:hypothetical protein